MGPGEELPVIYSPGMVRQPGASPATRLTSAKRIIIMKGIL
jgi:hypothetical protein